MNRENYVVCNSTEIPNFPICISSSNEPFTSDEYKDLVFNTCDYCGCVQLKDLIDIKLLYQNNHNNTAETSSRF